MNKYKNFIYELGRKQVERYIWNSTEATEDYICYLNNWISNDGVHGTDAFTQDGRHIEIKTQAFTGNSKKALNGTFTFSAPSLNITERVKNEEIHIFGRDDLTYKIVYHFSISGAEFAPTLIDYCNTGKTAAINWNFNLYKDFKSFKIHSFDKKHMKKYPKRWSDELIKLLIGDIKYYKKFYKKELKGYELLEVHKSSGTKTKFTVRSKKYGIETTRLMTDLKKWKPKSVRIKNAIAVPRGVL